ncbi:TetR/AcrR family transcriptional regulator [Dactylosporangium sp. CA-139066]|uniref:TetR/AcrR family transcriptional regulator n=1 Tax=Dactylosporangium sp. CA-139066 TaxID=3239930 RepID=UPI003D8D23B3
MENGLRARKKQRTRQALSEAATELFAARGFESVTIAEIAARADVGVGTVFNYFRSKEELFFDRAHSLEQSLVSTVASRPPGESMASAFRRWHESELSFLLDPRGAPQVARYFSAIAASHALQTAEHALFDRLQAALSPLDPSSGVLAALLMAIHRTTLTAFRDALPHGHPEAEARARDTSATGFAALSPTALTWGTA